MESPMGQTPGWSVCSRRGQTILIQIKVETARLWQDDRSIHKPMPTTVIQIQIKLFNALTRYGPHAHQFGITLPCEATVAQALEKISVPVGEIFVLWLNGHNIMQGFGTNSGIETHHTLQQGDVLALSGAVPFSRGYGSPVC